MRQQAMGWAALMVLGAACGGDDGPGQVSDAIAALDTAVGSDAFTPADGQDGVDADDAGDSADGAPVSQACSTDADCPEAGAVCACDGACVVPGGGPCTEAFNCTPSEWCNPCTNHCEAMLEVCDVCAPVTLCEAGGACRTASGGPCAEQGSCLAFAEGGTFCGRACITAAACPAGHQCLAIDGVAQKQCVPKSGSCVDLGLCESDSECPDGQICNEALKECGQGCVDDVSCPGGGTQVCVAGRCVPPCVTNADCEAPAECQVGGKCKVPGACESSTECDPEHYCDKLQGKCVPGCLIDEHCQDASLECQNLLCVQKGCAHNYQCGFEQECDKPNADCVAMTRDHCAPCDAQSQSSQCGGEPSLCVTFQDEEENPLGDFCILTCDADEVDKCPQGYQCEQIQSDDGSIDDFYCVRQCYFDPVGGP